MYSRQENIYNYRINEINLKNGANFQPGRVNVFVGANNCGKTQLLKDILAYINGSSTAPVILSNLELSYPSAWEEFVTRYPMDITDTNLGMQQIRHISPTLDAQPITFQSSSLLTDIKRSLQNQDKQRFRKYTGPAMVTFLNTDNRLSLSRKCTVQNLQTAGPKNVLEALYNADLTAPNRIRELVNDTFNTDIYFDYTDPGTLQFRIGHDFSQISENSRIAYSQVSQYPILDNQGDGLRSYVGMISALMALSKPIILLDEPEAFLHPPQALQLGMSIASLISESQQIFISTHSSDFLRGLLSSTDDAVIVHLSRVEESSTEISVLDSKTLNTIIKDPLLSSSRVLEGMFYKGVVATEADADAVFYQRLFQKIGPSDEIHFVNAHNKQTLKKVIQPYQTLGIRFALIADADVIRDKVEFKNIIDGIANEDIAKVIMDEREAVYSYFQKQNKYEILEQLRNKTQKFASQSIPSSEDNPQTIASALFDFRKGLNKLREDSDELSNFKKHGREALKDDKITYEIFNNLLKHCANLGLFIVPVGELESWLVDYDVARSSNKSKWITKALEKLFDIEYNPEKEIWKFMDSLKAYLTNN
jgi:energy-coupling factor transporter ATP-binding protein EcfA2